MSAGVANLGAGKPKVLHAGVASLTAPTSHPKAKRYKKYVLSHWCDRMKTNILIWYYIINSLNFKSYTSVTSVSWLSCFYFVPIILQYLIKE